MRFYIETFVFLCFHIASTLTNDDVDEEFRVSGPNEIHTEAVKSYLAVRAKDPANFNLSEDSPVMKSARDYAVKRLFVPHESAMKLTSVQM